MRIFGLERALQTTRCLLGALPSLPASACGGVPGLLRHHAARQPDRPCLLAGARRMSYGQVEAEVNRAARFWRRRGVGRGEVVALIMGNRPETLIHQLALGRLGAASAMINTHLAGPSLAHALHACRARAVLVDGPHAGAIGTMEGPLAARLPGGAWLAPEAESASPELRCVAPLLDRLSDAPLRGAPLGPGCVYTYLFTSGTTGLPKAAPIPHARFTLLGAGLHALGLWLRPSDVLFTPMPLYHASAQMVTFGAALAAGAAFACAPRFSASQYWRQAREVGATVGTYVGELCRFLLSAPEHPDERRHTIHTFLGNGMRPDVWVPFQRRFGDPRVVEFYGATEGNAFLLNRGGKVGSCGRPPLPGRLGGVTLVRYDVASESHPRDARGHLIRCETGETGELIAPVGWLLPHRRFSGYVDATATGQKILRGVFRRGDRWFRSGDLLRRDAEGDYVFVDRIGDTFRWRGENVSTQEVAEALTGAPGIAVVTVYGVEVPGQEGRVGMARLQLATGAVFDPVALWRQARDHLPPYARPAFLRLSVHLDTTSTLKLQKHRAQAAGFDSARCGEDALLVRVDAEGTYRPLDRARLQAVVNGTLRL